MSGAVNILTTLTRRSFVKSVQHVSITIASGNTTGTAIISAVDVSKSIRVYQGITTEASAANQYNRASTRVALTDSTHVTATRNTTGSAVTVNVTIIEFLSGVNSIQSGIITIAGGTQSNTAIISAVGAKAFVLFGGSSTAGTTAAASGTSVELTDSTTVTTRVTSSGVIPTFATVVDYMVVDLSDDIVESVQQRSLTDATTDTSYSDTISSVDMSRTLLFYNGQGSTGSIASRSNIMELTATDTVDFTRDSTNTVSRTLYYTAVQFALGVFERSVQRGVINISSGVSNTAIISPVYVAKSLCNFCGFMCNTTTPNTAFTKLFLDDIETVEATVNSTATTSISFEIARFN